MTETYLRTLTIFDKDHFRPKKLFGSLANVYSNFYYCCADCNRKKGAAWPNDDQVSNGYYFVDPCEEDPYDKHIHVRSDGTLQEQTNAGKYTIKTIRLDRDTCRIFRVRRIRAKQRIDAGRAEVEDLSRTLRDPIAFAAATALLDSAEREWLECFAPLSLTDSMSSELSS
jgi:hypothetical protein